MPRLYARCPNTKALIDTGIKSDLDTLSKLTEKKLRFCATAAEPFTRSGSPTYSLTMRTKTGAELSRRPSPYEYLIADIKPTWGHSAVAPTYLYVRRRIMFAWAKNNPGERGARRGHPRSSWSGGKPQPRKYYNICGRMRLSKMACNIGERLEECLG